MRRTTAASCLSLPVIALLALVPAPERSQGISMHMLPRRVAEMGGQKWGFVVAYAEQLKPETAQPVLQTTSEVLSFVRKQDLDVQANGVWIVVTHPDAYSEPERALLEDVKTMCRREAIPLFIARASQLPNGWQRYDVSGPEDR